VRKYLPPVRYHHLTVFWCDGERQIFTACSEVRKVLFLTLSVTFLFVYEISLELLNGFASNSHGRRVWSLARTSLKVKDQGHQGQKTAFFGPFGFLHAVYVS